MFPGMNPKMVKDAMKKMGIKQEAIEATEVIIKTPTGNLIIRNPEVVKINAMGQESLQITGKIEEAAAPKFTDDDVKTVASQGKVSVDKAREALVKSNGDLAEAILDLQQ